MKSKVLLLLAIHSTLAFVLAFMLNTMVHEGAHALVAKVSGLNPVLHHNYVSTTGESDSLVMEIMRPAAGPVMSLISGLTFLLLLKIRQKKSLLTLFFLWMSVMGFINIGGYLALTPLIDYGDTGKVFALLGAPQWLKWAVAILGLAALMKIIVSFTNDFEHQLPDGIDAKSFVPGKLANSLLAYPIMTSVVLCSLISLPVPTFASILYPTTSPFIVFMVYGRLRRKKEMLTGKANYPQHLSFALVAFTIVAFIITRLLVAGVTL